jgi:hypothetical protein
LSGARCAALRATALIELIASGSIISSPPDVTDILMARRTVPRCDTAFLVCENVALNYQS